MESQFCKIGRLRYRSWDLSKVHIQWKWSKIIGNTAYNNYIRCKRNRCWCCMYWTSHNKTIQLREWQLKNKMQQEKTGSDCWKISLPSSKFKSCSISYVASLVLSLFFSVSLHTLFTFHSLALFISFLPSISLFITISLSLSLSLFLSVSACLSLCLSLSLSGSRTFWIGRLT